MRFVWLQGKKRPLHRLVMEKKLGRPLVSDEIVRHRDGDLLNNDPGNLVIVSREEHFRLSMIGEAKDPWSEEEKDEAVRLYCRGMTIDEVARAVRRSYSATRRLLARWGVLRTPRATRALRASESPAGEPKPYRNVQKSLHTDGLAWADFGGVTLNRLNSRNPFDLQRPTESSFRRAPAL
jgi:transposase-like protein